PEAAASIHYDFKPGDVTLGYARSQTTVIGLAGPVDVHSVSATASWSLRRSLQVRVSPGLYRTAQHANQANVYHVFVDVVRPITGVLSIDAAVDVNLQRGSLYAGFGDVRIPRHVAVIKLVAAPATRRR